MKSRLNRPSGKVRVRTCGGAADDGTCLKSLLQTVTVNQNPREPLRPFSKIKYVSSTNGTCCVIWDAAHNQRTIRVFQTFFFLRGNGGGRL